MNLGRSAWAMCFCVHACAYCLSQHLCGGCHFKKPSWVMFSSLHRANPNTPSQQLALTSHFAESSRVWHIFQLSFCLTPLSSQFKYFLTAIPRVTLFFSERKILAFTSLTRSVCPLPVSPFFLYPASLLIPWYCGCLWRTGNETPFSPLLSVTPTLYHTETLSPSNGCLSLP